MKGVKAMLEYHYEYRSRCYSHTLYLLSREDKVTFDYSPQKDRKHDYCYNSSRTDLKICLICVILQKYHLFHAYMLGDSILFRTFAPLFRTICK